MPGAKQLLVLTTAGDEHALAVTDRLRAMNQSALFFDYGRLPERARMGFGTDPDGRLRRWLAADAAEIDLDRVGAVWIRRPTPIVGLLPARERYYQKVETTSLFYSLMEALPVPWFPADPLTIKRADGKIGQLSRARSLGLEIPPTLITNDAKRFLQFFNAHEGKVISKIAEGAAFDISFPRMTRYTESVKRRDLAYISRLRNCPTLFQANVPKQMELRVTVVGQRVFAAAIFSQASRQAAQDWRRYDDRHTPYRPFDLPPAISESCRRLIADLGLFYGTIDLIVKPDGSYVFLEVNPNGQYLWIEELTGLPITEAIADHLSRLLGS